jgi:hypothetical protein
MNVCFDVTVCEDEFSKKGIDYKNIDLPIGLPFKITGNADEVKKALNKEIDKICKEIEELYYGE